MQTNYICRTIKIKLMKIVTQVLAVVGLLFLASCGGGEKAELPPVEKKAEVKSVGTTYDVDVAVSSAHWKGEMMGMYSHEGEIKFTSGTVTTADGAIVSGEFVIDMTSMEPTDKNYDEKKTPRELVNHLSSDDFFAVEKHPTASFSFTGPESGDLTIREKTNPVKLKELSLNESETMLKASATLTFDRQDFDVAFSHPAKDMVLSNDVVLSIRIIGAK